MAHSNNVILIQVVFQSIYFFLPFHRPFQAVHGMGRVGLIALFHVEPQTHLPAGCRGEGVAHFLQLACHQGKQVGGFGKGVVP